MLSIIIPCKNEEKNLAVMLRSIKEQTFTDYEIIVAVSADTTDGTREVAASFGARVVVGGMPGTGRNRGAEVAKGDTFLFLDADGMLPDPWFLQMTVAEFQKRRLSIGTCLLEPMSDKVADKIFHDLFNFFILLTRDFAPHAPGVCIYVLRSIHEAIGGFDEEIRLAEDSDYACRAAKLGKFGVLRSSKITVSVRRLDRDGRLNVYTKLVLAEIYMRTKGQIKTDAFNYRFDHWREEHKTATQEIKERWDKLAKKAKAGAGRLKVSLNKEMKMTKRPRSKRPARKRKSV
jgi:glycosyltransferase involved in cell wall biosynthesis